MCLGVGSKDIILQLIVKPAWMHARKQEAIGWFHHQSAGATAWNTHLVRKTLVAVNVKEHRFPRESIEVTRSARIETVNEGATMQHLQQRREQREGKIGHTYLLRGSFLVWMKLRRRRLIRQKYRMGKTTSSLCLLHDSSSCALFTLVQRYHRQVFYVITLWSQPHAKRERDIERAVLPLHDRQVTLRFCLVMWLPLSKQLSSEPVPRSFEPHNRTGR